MNKTQTLEAILDLCVTDEPLSNQERLDKITKLALQGNKYVKEVYHQCPKCNWVWVSKSSLCPKCG